MRVGFTFDSREKYLNGGFSEKDVAEFDRNETIDAIEQALKNNGYKVDKIGSFYQLTSDMLGWDGVCDERPRPFWDIIFNICEGLYGIGREGQVPSFLDAHKIPYVFSDPLTMALTLHKGFTKRLLASYNIPHPKGAVIKNEEGLERFLEDFDRMFEFPAFIKPIAEGSGKGITDSSKIWSKDELRIEYRKLMDEFKYPILVEEFLSGTEYTVGIIGTGDNARVIGVMDESFYGGPEVYTYDAKEHYQEYYQNYKLARPGEASICGMVALSSYVMLGCRDAGRVDVRMDKNNIPNVLDVNPLPDFNPKSDYAHLAKLSGISYDDLIGRIMSSAISRI
jgi:D-alanine-D-alanine ligase